MLTAAAECVVSVF